MFDYIYQILSAMGYSHPLHPSFVHLPVGLTIGGFFFSFLGFLLKRKAFLRTSVHLNGMALFFLPLTVLAGYMDWGQYFGMAMLLEFKIKLILSGVLFILLCTSLFISIKFEEKYGFRFLLYILSFLTISIIGYYGGELVYGSKSSKIQASQEKASLPENDNQNKLVLNGEKLFAQRCMACHFTDKPDSKIGPGMKGIMKQDFFPTSNWPVSEENLKKQIRTPFRTMPGFRNMSDADMEALVEYIKGL